MPRKRKQSENVQNSKTLKRKQSKNVKNNKSLAANMSTVKGNKNLSKFNGEETLTYISEFNKVEIMREIYKDETKKYIEGHLEEKIKSEKNSNLQTAKKLRPLLDNSKTLLHQMDRNRTNTDQMMDDIFKISTKVLNTLNCRGLQDEFLSTEESIRNLLTDLKTGKP